MSKIAINWCNNSKWWCKNPPNIDLKRFEMIKYQNIDRIASANDRTEILQPKFVAWTAEILISRQAEAQNQSILNFKLILPSNSEVDFWKSVPKWKPIDERVVELDAVPFPCGFITEFWSGAHLKIDQKCQTSEKIPLNSKRKEKIQPRGRGRGGIETSCHNHSWSFN